MLNSHQSYDWRRPKPLVQIVVRNCFGIVTALHLPLGYGTISIENPMIAESMNDKYL